VRSWGVTEVMIGSFIGAKSVNDLHEKASVLRFFDLKLRECCFFNSFCKKKRQISNC
jgi:hypothetical protein